MSNCQLVIRIAALRNEFGIVNKSDL